MKKILFIFFLFFTVVSYAQLSSDQEVVVLSITSEVHNQNVKETRDKAIKNLIKEAVKKVALNWINQEQTYLIEEGILDNINKFVDNYRIISELSSEDLYRITIEISVNRKRLKEALLNIGLIRKRKPLHLTKVDVIILGGETYFQFKSILDIAKKDWAVDNNVKISSMTPEEWVFRLKTPFSPQEFANKVSKEDFKGFYLNLVKVSSEKIYFKLIEKEE
ncbi:MAG: hypothetical protein JRI44_06280 [Deltaproteobacteria bacterium]|nr:hypothetical protein [Deltaproteobacteria bacterium]